MAVDYSKVITPTVNPGQAIGAGLSSIAEALPNRDEVLTASATSAIENALGSTVSLLGKDVKEWDLGIDEITKSENKIDDAFTIYTKWIEGLSPSDRERAKRLGLTATKFGQVYKTTADSIGSMLNQKIEVSGLDDKELRTLFKGKENLTNFLRMSDLNLQTRLAEPKGVMDQLSGWRDFFTPNPEEEGIFKTAFKTGISPYGMSITAGDIIEGATDYFGASDKTSRIAGEVGEITGGIAGGVAFKEAVPMITKYIKDKGMPSLLKKAVKKMGVARVAATLGKIGVGALGLAPSGGALTAIMAAWTAKDIYDIIQIIQEDTKKETK